MMFYFGDESAHIHNMASRANRDFGKPYDYEKEPVMSDFIPEREDGKQFIHPSEIDPRTHEGIRYSYELKKQLEAGSTDTRLSKDETIALVSAVGFIVVGLALTNLDDITDIYNGISSWAENKMNDYINPGTRK